MKKGIHKEFKDTKFIGLKESKGINKNVCPLLFISEC